MRHRTLSQGAHMAHFTLWPRFCGACSQYAPQKIELLWRILHVCATESFDQICTKVEALHPSIYHHPFYILLPPPPSSSSSSLPPHCVYTFLHFVVFKPTIVDRLVRESLSPTSRSKTHLLFSSTSLFVYYYLSIDLLIHTLSHRALDSVFYLPGE